MKPIADDTIYFMPCGTRVRIVAEQDQSGYFVVAEVRNGKRWYGYTKAQLMTEKVWHSKKRPCPGMPT